MSVNSIEFLLSFLVIAAVFHLLPGRRARQVTLTLLGFGFLATMRLNLASLVALGTILASGYAVALILRRHPSRWLLACYLCLLVGAFIYIKRYAFVLSLLPRDLLDHPLTITGLSYILFRQIHFIVDAMEKQIERPSAWTYLTYQINPLTLLAGPIQRYQEYQESWDDLRPFLPDREAVLRSYIRIFVGVIKVAVVANACLLLYEACRSQLTPESRSELAQLGKLGVVGRFVTLVYAMPIFIYFNFSGYCDIVIAAAALLGMRLPENFDWPFLSRNMMDYWTRFHITLGLWIRDYLFNPLYKSMVERRPQSFRSIGIVCYFIAFSLSGVWHGSTWNFVIYGFLNGLGVSAAKLWETIIVARTGRSGLRAYLQSRWIKWVAIVLTFHYVCFTYYFFNSDMAGSIQAFQNTVWRITH